MKKFHVISIVMGAALLVWLVMRIGPLALWHQLGMLGWWLGPLILIQAGADLFHTLAWRRCLSRDHQRFSFGHIYQIYMAGFALNYLTPTAQMGGEVTRGTLLTSRGSGSEAASGVIIGKLTESIALLLFVSVGSLFILSSAELPHGLFPALAAGSLLMGGGIAAFLLLQRFGKLGGLVRWLSERNVGGQALVRLAENLSKVDASMMRFHRERPWDLLASVGWHMAGCVVGIVQAVLFLYALTGRPMLTQACGVWLLSSWFNLLAFAVPLGIGIHEGGRVLAFQIMGLDAVMGLTYGITLRLEQIFWALFGLGTYALLMNARRPARPVPLNLE